MTPPAKAQLVKQACRDVGFDLVGITPAGPVERGPYYRDWLAAGYGGSMGYLRRNVETRLEPGRLLPGARSVVCVGLNYKRGSDTAPETDSAGGNATRSRARPLGKVASYARGRDYHDVMREMLADAMTRVRERLQEPFEYRVCVDTAPVLERELARAAGLGWVGKNTCVLNQRLGSYLFLAEAITTLDLPPDEPVLDRCGRCTRCLDACPTRAFPAPYQLDASRCISYLTIEHRGPVPEEFHATIGDWVFGCDICQQVCPYNRRAPVTGHADITADRMRSELDLLDLLRLRSGAYRRMTHGSATHRARRNMWRRNAAIAMGNVANLDARAAAEVNHVLAEATRDQDPAIRHAALCAQTRLATRAAT